MKEYWEKRALETYWRAVAGSHE